MKEKDLILSSLSIGFIALGLAIPTLEKELVLAFGSQGVAIRKLTEFVVTALSCWAYTNSKLRRVIKKTLLYAYVPSVIIALGIVILCWKEFDPLIFMIGFLIECMGLSIYISRSLTGLRAWLFSNPEDREMYDNSKNLWTAVAAVVGYGISSFIETPIKPALILFLVGCLGHTGWVVVYLRHRKEYLKEV